VRKKEHLHSANWGVWSAFGDKRYRSASRENLKKSSGKKKNNDAGVIGKAGLIVATNADPDRMKTYHKINDKK